MRSHKLRKASPFGGDLCLCLCACVCACASVCVCVCGWVWVTKGRRHQWIDLESTEARCTLHLCVCPPQCCYPFFYKPAPAQWPHVPVCIHTLRPFSRPGARTGGGGVPSAARAQGRSGRLGGNTNRGEGKQRNVECRAASMQSASARGALPTSLQKKRVCRVLQCCRHNVSWN
jgi:hypothetical protein